jgi:hypothetical protein
VIAIENIRLFNEVEARTEELAKSVQELRALGEVSQAVNSTLDLAVLSTIVANAVHLSGTEAGTIYTFDETTQKFELRSTYGMDNPLIAARYGSGISASAATRNWPGGVQARLCKFPTCATSHRSFSRTWCARDSAPC